LNIIVLAGGLSPERNVSLSSGSLISSALRRKGHKVLMLDVYEGIQDEKITSNPMELFTLENSVSLTVGNTAPTPEEIEKIKQRNNNRSELIGPNVLRLCKLADVTFLALHGDMGENGQLQATLDVFDITYTGSGYIGSLLAMNKDIAKKLMRESNILTPDWINFNEFGDEDKISNAAKKIGFPCIVKPCSCGSSVGVSIVNNESELRAALDFAAQYENSILIEKHISGRELTQAILDNEALPPVEIIPKCGFYDYANKYVANATEEICPAPLSNSLREKIDNISKKCFNALNLSDYARIDYIVDKDESIWCLEANTLPGMTPTSLMPQEADAIGIDYDSLCEKIANIALAKNK
jgi:D-alanine-D-alanine ligase